MGFWGGLGKILGAAAPIIAAPFTGGASLAGLPAILGTAAKVGGAVAPVLGGMAAGRAEGRAKEESGQLQRDAIDLRGSEHAMDAFKLNQGANRRDMSDMAMASMSGAKPFSFQLPPRGSGMKMQGSGGFMERRPEMSQLSDMVAKDILARKMSGGNQFNPTFKGAAPAPKSGVLDKILGIGSGAAGILGAVGASGVLPKPQAPLPSRQVNIPGMYGKY